MSAGKQLVSLVVPAFNEAPVLRQNLAALLEAMQELEQKYDWELILVNDGSSDDTAAAAAAFAEGRDNVTVIHHMVNLGLGQALRTGFAHCRGDMVVTYDLDLSYSPAHIGALLEMLETTRAQIVVASPYMEGGRVSNVPWFRRMLSRWANRFLALAAPGRLSTLTSMVRAYDGRFLKTLDLKSMGMDVNSEILYKGMVLRARIREVPAHLDWRLQRAKGIKRVSSMRVLHTTLATLISGFLFRPFMLFILPGFLLFLASLWINGWVLVHIGTHYASLSEVSGFDPRVSAAVAAAYRQAPHAFIVGGIALVFAVQLMSLGLLALQSKRYFEEVFHLGTTVYRQVREDVSPPR